MERCSYCKLPIRKRWWISIPGLAPDSTQCDRLWCRLFSGHLWWALKCWWKRLKQVDETEED